MPTHPKTSKSFAEKSDQYIREDCTEPPLTESPQIRKLLGDESGKRVLCVGCGSGAECSSLAARGAIVAGVDSSQALLDLAKSKCPDLKLELASIDALPYSDNAFDLVYCGHLLHYLNDWTQALNELHRVLTNSGKLVITIHHPADQGYTGDVPKEIHAIWYKDFDVVFYPRSLRAMSRTFEEAGFQISQMTEMEGEADKPPLVVAYELKIAR
jgi:ubiquinone/menaquinone biosynthesis C-methylase UbiE